MPRKIIHLDLDAFFCAVEEQRDTGLVGKPFAVGGRPEARGVVASCSYAARQFGVRSAMPMAHAIRLCPELIILSSRHGVYSQVSQKVMAHLFQLTPLVEQLSIDEAFLDISEFTESAELVARRLQASIHKDPGLPCSLGVATNKLIAKIATDVGKAAALGGQPPNAITVVPPGDEARFLAPLPVQALWGVGPKTAARLASLGVTTIGELAGIPENELVRMFGKNGSDLAQRAQGIDNHPIVTSREAKSISQETTFDHDIRDPVALRKVLFQLAEGVGRRLRQANLTGRIVKLKIRWPDFTTLTRQQAVDQPLDVDQEIYQRALELFERVWKPGQAVRLLGVGVSGLGRPARQLSFWDVPVEKERRLQAVLDTLRQRYGRQAIRRGSTKEKLHG